MSFPSFAYLGPARSGKTEELMRQYRAALVSQPAGGNRHLWLVPTVQAAAMARRQLVRNGFSACLSPGIVTFDHLAKEIVQASGARVRRLGPAMRRELLQRIVNSALKRDALEFYADAAERTGFIDLLAEHFRELKRHEISPVTAAKVRLPSGDARQQLELAILYGEYQQLLATHRLVDAESVYWAARDALKAGICSEFRELNLLAVDGFTDFTSTQHEILALLSRGARQFIVTLQADVELSSDSTNRVQSGHSSDQAVGEEDSAPSALRTDLFAKTGATLAALHIHHPRLAERHFAPRASSWPALDYLSRQLFRHPRRVAVSSAAVAASLDRLEVIEAASAHDEIVQIARRIKRLLTGGATARPGDILVVFRTLSDAAPRVQEVFTQFGIPYAIDSSERLSAAAVVMSLLAVLRLDSDDWPFRGVISVLTNNSLSAFDAGQRQAADWLVRELQVAEGRGTLLERIEQLAGETTPPSELSGHVRRRVEGAQAALPLLRLLAEALERLPTEETASGWCTAWKELGSRLGLSPFGGAEATVPTGHLSDQSAANLIDEGASNDPDQIAWQCVVEHFAALERLDTWLGLPPRKLSRRDALDALADAARHSSLPRRHDDVGRVRVLPALTARTITARHVFLAGMSEQAFPAPERAGRLGTEAMYRTLADAKNGKRAARSGQSALAVTRSQEEMLLFYGVVNCAEESLTISFPALDDKAQELPASPYVTELRRILAVTCPSGFRTTSPHLSPVPAGNAPYSVSELRVQAVAKALAGDFGLLAGLVRSSLGSGIDAGLRMVYARAHGEAFGPAEGLLTSPAAAARFAQRYGPQHLWSPSQWESYAACPYKFFLEQVLGLEPLGDLVLETDFARRGSRLHDVLAEFYRHWPSIRGDGNFGDEQEAAAFIEHFCHVVDSRVATNRAGIDAALLELDRRQLRNWAEGHREHHARYDGQWSKLAGPLVPAHFELRFGPARPGDADAEDPQSCSDAFTLNINGESVRITGRIDRIDVARVGERVQFTVIDYKSGRKTSLTEEHIESGEHLQLPIYVAAAQALVFGGKAEPLAAGYWTMSRGFDAKGVLAVQQDDETSNRWDRVQTMVEQRVGQFIAAIRRGEFPVHSRDERCTSRCDFNTVCRVAQVRSVGKMWPPETKA